MTYPVITAHRMPYDIDGTEVGVRNNLRDSIANSFDQGNASWLSQQNKQDLNAVQRSYGIDGGEYADQAICLWFFFPEVREITHLGLYFKADCGEAALADSTLQGSNDTTNGMDGTWENAVVSIPAPNRAADYWRSTIRSVSFSTAYKVIRLGIKAQQFQQPRLCGVHLYGQKAAGQMPDDVMFCTAAGAELTALSDWGDQPEGTTEIGSFKVKNVSPSKIANNINLQLNHADFAMAWSPDGPWVTVLDIATLGIGALSNTIYVRNQLGPPLLTLGPKAARVIATVGSWT